MTASIPVVRPVGTCTVCHDIDRVTNRDHRWMCHPCARRYDIDNNPHELKDTHELDDCDHE